MKLNILRILQHRWIIKFWVFLQKMNRRFVHHLAVLKDFSDLFSWIFRKLKETILLNGTMSHYIGSTRIFVVIYIFSLSLHRQGILWKKGALQNPSKRFCRFPKSFKMCPKSQKKDKKFYRTLWRFCVLPNRRTFFLVLYSKKRFREKIRNLEGSVQNH